MTKQEYLDFKQLCANTGFQYAIIVYLTPFGDVCKRSILSSERMELELWSEPIIDKYKMQDVAYFMILNATVVKQHKMQEICELWGI